VFLRSTEICPTFRPMCWPIRPKMGRHFRPTGRISVPFFTACLPYGTHGTEYSRNLKRVQLNKNQWGLYAFYS
jgi:hypothetical protein